MSTKNLLLGLFATVALLATAFTGPVETYTADIERSNLVWKGYKVTGEHTGTVALKDGNLKYQDGKLIGGSFVIDMTSITVTDLEGEWKTKLEGHLKSADFFGVEKYPTATFTITQVVSRGKAGEYKIVGDLSIKEKTQEIRFLANIDESADSPVAKANITIDRSKYDVRYGSGSFFDNLGDKTIYDEFDIALEMVIDKES